MLDREAKGFQKYSQTILASQTPHLSTETTAVGHSDISPGNFLLFLTSSSKIGQIYWISILNSSPSWGSVDSQDSH